MLPKQIGNYRILRLIGQGGMASVYQAEHSALGRMVAIKVLNPVLSVSPQIRERFKNEARIMAALNHPNITQVLDFDEQPQQLSIIMELLEGEDLSSRIRGRGPLQEIELKGVFEKVLSALQYAHDKGVVHRDIKPSNIYLLPNGQVKVLDFGIAKVYGQVSDLTQAGQLIGTPVYMSPEQVLSDKTIDHRTDIYSLGVTMYYALSGKAPYDDASESTYGMLSRIVKDPLASLSGYPLLDGMIQKACQKDRDHRFQTCREWLHLFERNITIAATPAFSQMNGDRTVMDGSSVKKTEVAGAGDASSAPVQDPETKSSTPRIVGIIAGLFVIGGALWFTLKYSDGTTESVDQKIPVQSPSETDEFQFERYCNNRYAYCIEYPSRVLFPQGESENGDGQAFVDKDNQAKLRVYRDYRYHLESGESSDLASAYQEDISPNNPYYPNRIITYKRLAKHFFVISGYNEGKIFYQKTIRIQGELATSSIEYPESRKDYFNEVSEKIFQSFKPVE